MRKPSPSPRLQLDLMIKRVTEGRHLTSPPVIRSALPSATAGVAFPRITAVGVAHGPGAVAADVDRHLAESGFGER